ncbi:salivary C-type lectin 2-like [Glandiceps talaboti]
MVIRVLLVLSFALCAIAGDETMATYRYCSDCYTYKISCGSLNYMEAIYECENSGGHLAVIQTEKLLDNIKAAVESAEMNTIECNNYGFWIGYEDKNTEDPRPFDHSAEDFEWIKDTCPVYVRWEDNQPDDSDFNGGRPQGQNCVQLWFRKDRDADGDYDDDFCLKKKGYVCQFDAECSCPEKK